MRLRITLEDKSYDVAVEVIPEEQSDLEGEELLMGIPESVLQPPHPLDTLPEDKICHSPIAGVVVAVMAKPGQVIQQNEPIATIEAMKMQNTIGAPMDGIVEEVTVNVGEAVKMGQVLCRLS